MTDHYYTSPVMLVYYTRSNIFNMFLDYFYFSSFFYVNMHDVSFYMVNK